MQNKYVQLILTLAIGIGIGAIFYPSKTITKEEISTYKQKIERLENEKHKIDIQYMYDLNKLEKENKQYEEVTDRKVDSLRQENFKLKQKVSEKHFKIIKPDGTIEEQWFKDSETEVVASVVTEIKEEFTRKVKSIENRWKVTHEKRVKKIKQEYERKLSEALLTTSTHYTKTKTEINKRNFGISIGVSSRKDYVSSITYDVYGPFFIDVHIGASQEFNDQETGIGLGFRF